MGVMYAVNAWLHDDMRMLQRTKYDYLLLIIVANLNKKALKS